MIIGENFVSSTKFRGVFTGGFRQPVIGMAMIMEYNQTCSEFISEKDFRK
jgi:hypothetical protein